MLGHPICKLRVIKEVISDLSAKSSLPWRCLGPRFRCYGPNLHSCALGSDAAGLVSGKANQPPATIHLSGQREHNDFLLLALGCHTLKLLWQLKGRFTICFLSTYGKIGLAM